MPPHPSTDRHAPDDLLSALDALVRADPAAPGFAATLCFGVRGRGYWTVVLDGRARGSFSETPAEFADAWLGIGQLESEALLGGVPMPADPFAVIAGNAGLMQRFVARYLGQSSWLQLRIGR